MRMHIDKTWTEHLSPRIDVAHLRGGDIRCDPRDEAVLHEHVGDEGRGGLVTCDDGRREEENGWGRRCEGHAGNGNVERDEGRWWSVECSGRGV